nr:hypothetical protein [Caldilineaceae bacterium]
QLVVTAPLASQHTYYFRITGPAGVHRWPATGYMTEANLFVADKPPIPTPAPGTPTPALTPTATATPTLTLTITPPATGGPFPLNLPLLSSRQ